MVSVDGFLDGFIAALQKLRDLFDCTQFLAEVKESLSL